MEQVHVRDCSYGIPCQCPHPNYDHNWTQLQSLSDLIEVEWSSSKVEHRGNPHYSLVYLSVFPSSTLTPITFFLWTARARVSSCSLLSSTPPAPPPLVHLPLSLPLSSPFPRTIPLCPQRHLRNIFLPTSLTHLLPPPAQKFWA